MSVEFKLFGELTLKQFLYVGGAGAIAYLIIASEMALPLKIFLAVIVAGIGAALALIPINNRPLEVWVGNFLLSMLNPTKRVWKKGENPNIPKTIYNLDEYNKQAPASLPTAPATQTAQPANPLPQPPPSLLSTTNNTKIEPTMDTQNTSKNLQKVLDTSESTKPTAPKARQTFVLDMSKLNEHGARLPGYSPKPNVIKGVVKDKAGSLIEGAVVIIKRQENNQPARAMVTNALGEFETTTQLDNGTYLVDISHKGSEAPIYEIKLDATPLPPLQFQFTA